MKTVIKSYLSLVFLLFMSTSLFAQTITPTEPFDVGNPACRQNNLQVVSYQFRDANGNIFDPASIADFEIGQPVMGQIWATWAVSGNGYNPHIQFDIFTNGTRRQTIANCVVVEDANGNTRNVVNGDVFKIADFTWNFGEKLEIENIYITWETGNAQANNKSCPTSAGNSQCSFPGIAFVVNTPLVANFDFETNCENLSVSFENLTTGGEVAGYNFTWNFGDGNTSTQVNPTHTYTTAGTYTVTLTARDGLFERTITKQVEVNNPISLEGVVTNDDCSVSAAGAIDLTVSGGDGTFTYLWTATDGGIIPSGQENNEDLTGLVEGTYTVNVEDDRGCIRERTFVITRPEAAPTLTIGETPQYCVGSGPRGYDVTADAGYSLIFYDSETSPDPLGTVPVVNTDNSGAGTFSVWVSQIKDGECESERVQVSIIVNPLPVLSITNPAPVCEPGTVDLTAAAVTSGSSGFNTLEYFTNEAATEVLNDPNAVAQSGTYYIKATSGAGCFVILPVVVVVNEAPAAPESSGNITECALETIQTLDARDAITAVTGITYRWYDVAEGGSEVTPTWNQIGSKTYYAEAVTDDGCASLSRTAVTLTINDCRVEISKEANLTEIDVPTTLNYTIRVSNPGNFPLTGVVVTDPLTDGNSPLALVSGDDNGNNALDTDETWVYNASFEVTQAMIDAGTDIVNTAFVNSDQTGEEEASVRTTIVRSPVINITKSASPGTYSTVGEQITYTFVVSNTGNVTLTNVGVADALPGLGTITPGPVTLAPGENQTFTATYQITLADLNAGSVVNTATASGTPPSGPAVSDTDSETITAEQNAAISIHKSANPGTYSTVGEQITYTFVVRNTGNVTLSNVSVNDPLQGLGTISPASATLNPGDSETFTASYTITLADLNAGKVDNTATATGTPPAGPAVSDTDSETITAEQSPAIRIVKTADPKTYSEAGDVITYTFEVTNTGNVTLSNVSVSDPLPGLGTISPASATLNPGDSETFTASYTITLADMNAGKVDNTATATGTPPTGPAVSDTDSETITAEQSPAIRIVKTADPKTYSEAGDVITYTFEVTNTGNVTLSNVSVTDPLPGLATIIPASVTLNPGDSETFTATYTITLADMNAGKVDNTATATGTPPTGPAVTATDSETITANQNPSIRIVKTADKTAGIQEGDVILYTYVVTNTGNITINNVSVEDNHPGTGNLSDLTTSDDINNVAPGQSVTFTATYVVTQEDIDRGIAITNLATATATGVNGATVTNTDTETITPEAAAAGIELEKKGEFVDVNENGRADAGDQITYTFTISNTGNVTLRDITVTDPLVEVSGGPLASLAPGATDGNTFTAVYTLTQEDIDLGTFTNTATVTGQYSGDVTATDSDTQVFERLPNLSMNKTADVSTVNAAGDVIVYTITVTNTGNVTIGGIIKNDDKVSFNRNVGSLAPGESVSVEVPYEVTQEDIDRGIIENIAGAVGQDPEGNDTATEDNAIVNVDQNASLSLNKTADKTSVSAAGEEIVYTLIVANNGNVTIENVTVIDERVNVNENVGTLAPGESATVTATYTVSQADMDAGSIVNVATVSGTDPNGEDTDTEDGVTVDTEQNASLSLNKTADKTSVSAAGEEIVYTLTVTNNGNVTIENVTVVDEKVNVNENVGTLAPGESATVTVTYTVSQADMDAGSIVNVATVSGTDPNGEDTDSEDSVTVDTEVAAQITVSKSVDSDTYTEIGQVLNYTITVKNTGSVTITNITVVDPLTGFEASIESLAPGEEEVFTTSYTITLRDLENGTVVNTVLATGTDPDGGEVTDEDSVTSEGSSRRIIANDDEFGEFPINFSGVLGNILENDLLEGERPDPNDVDFEFTELDGIVGLNINENGELSLLIPGINEPREYRLKYTLRETVNPTNFDEAFVIFRLLENEVDLSVEKTSNEIEVFEGDEFNYIITVRNNGGTDAENVVVTDELPNGVSYVSTAFVSTDPSVDLSTEVQGSRVIWSIPVLPADAVVTITLRVRADALNGEVPLTITNQVTIVSDGDETNPADNIDTDVNRVNPFFIPNVITPDGDGKNDTFEIKGLNKFVSNEIVILNRYGDHVFERKNYENDWNAPGQVAGTYFYVLVGVDSQGRTHEFKGWIQVIK